MIIGGSTGFSTMTALPRPAPPTRSMARAVVVVNSSMLARVPGPAEREATDAESYPADNIAELVGAGVLTAPLPIGLDDNGDAVTEHDALEAEYYRQYTSSSFTRLRLRLKSASEPFEPATERQILVGIAVLSVLAIWRLGAK